MGVLKAGVDQAKVVEPVVERHPTDRDGQIVHVGEVGEPQTAGPVDLAEDHLLLRAIQRTPGPDPPLQRSADHWGELGVAPHQLLEDRHRAQPRRVAEHRNHFLIEDPGQRVRAPTAASRLPLGGQLDVRLEAVSRRRAEAGLRRRGGGGIGSSEFHVKPHLVIGYVSPRHWVFLLWSEETP